MYRVDGTEPKLADQDFEIHSRKITGDPQRSGRHDNTPPATAAEFIAATDAVLAVPGVYGVRWRQFTPYFNDGEPCEFGVQDIEVRLRPLDEEDERGDYEDGWIDIWSMGYSRKSEPERYPEVTDSIFEMLDRASDDWKALNAEEVCKRNFGDHAVVTATSEGFDVEFYDHD